MARPGLAALLALVSVVLFATSGASAQQETGGGLLLIMDASNSMNKRDDRGTPLIEGAKGALNQVVETLPDGTPVGLRVYGHRTPEAEGPGQGCRDTELIVPVGPLDRAGMTTAIEGYDARGWTPIGLSLQEAANDLPDDGPRTIVLVSDGEDTCGEPPPCRVARDLESRGVDVTIETVGFFVEGNEDAERQLTCIAEATGGSYRTAESADRLSEELTTISARAARTFQAEGERVEGAASADEAPVLVPGTYQDTILTDETLWYAVELRDGQELRARATVGSLPGLDPDVGVTTYLAVTMFDPLNEEILDPGPEQNPGVGPQAVSVATTSGIVDPDEIYANEPGPYYVRVAVENRAEYDELRNREFALELEFEVTGRSAQTTPQDPADPPGNGNEGDSSGPTTAGERPRGGGFLNNLYFLGIGALVGAFLAFPAGVVMTVLVMRRIRG